MEKPGLAINGVVRKRAEFEGRDGKPGSTALWVEYLLEDDRNPGEPEPHVDRFYFDKGKVPDHVKKGGEVMIGVRLIQGREGAPARFMAISVYDDRKKGPVVA